MGHFGALRFLSGQSRSIFVGDVKYRRTAPEGGPQPDLYQLLAYVVATNLRFGLMVYSAGEGVPTAYSLQLTMFDTLAGG